MTAINNFLAIIILISIKFTIADKAIHETDNFPSKCIVEIEGKTFLKSEGETWTQNNSCIYYSCEIDKDGTPYEKNTTIICSLECSKGYEYRNSSEKCCGECLQTECIYENETYKVGETWRSSNGCIIMECIKQNNTIEVNAFKKSCPDVTECPKQDIYTIDCCKYCKSSTNNTAENYKTNFDTYKNHPCKRNCSLSNKPMICEYSFHVEWYETLSKACYNCPFNKTDCTRRPHCIHADGVRRSVLVVNRIMPGPAIEVCLNDKIVVDVTNKLLGESTTFHWHGLHQKDNPYSDGVPHVTQCPILPNTIFRYIFKANQAGTFFWHSHTGMQRGDGCFGALIIRNSRYHEPKYNNIYDYDLSEHIMILQDWGHIPGLSMFSSHHHSIGSNKPPNILINGKGNILNTNSIENDNKFTMETVEITNKTNFEKYEYHEVNETNLKKLTLDDFLFPIEKFEVIKGFRYRFRIINAGFLNCPFAISFDNHTLLVISSDGYDIEPIEVTSLVIYAGERFDFILNANQQNNNYWIRIKGLMDCDSRFTSAHQVAILNYMNTKLEIPAGISPIYDYNVTGIELNSLNKGPGYVETLSIAEIKSLNEEEDWVRNKKPDYKFYIYYDFYPKDNPHFHIPNLYGFNQIINNKDNKLYTPQLNHISLKMPSIPLLPGRNEIDENKFCNSTSLINNGIDCRKDFCECNHIIQVALNSIVEIILVDEGLTYDANHPFHLHGYSFRVIGMDRLASNITIEKVKEMDQNGFIKRNLIKPPIKDTVTVPDGGYTIIRFKASNPGFWLLHCHIEFHAEIGMALIFKVGENDQMVPVPENFPTCSNYMPKIYIKDSSGGTVRLIFSSIFLGVTVITLKFL